MLLYDTIKHQVQVNGASWRKAMLAKLKSFLDTFHSKVTIWDTMLWHLLTQTTQL